MAESLKNYGITIEAISKAKASKAIKLESVQPRVIDHLEDLAGNVSWPEGYSKPRHLEDAISMQRSFIISNLDICPQLIEAYVDRMYGIECSRDNDYVLAIMLYTGKNEEGHLVMFKDIRKWIKFKNEHFDMIVANQIDSLRSILGGIKNG